MLTPPPRDAVITVPFVHTAPALACGVLAAGAVGAFVWGTDFTAFLGLGQKDMPLLGGLSQGLSLIHILRAGKVRRRRAHVFFRWQ